ncbi:MAG: dTDP-4-dehydrorhamnose reductase [Burkholderiales bacterium]
MKILLTGVTGQVGHHLKPVLEARGWEVIAPTRDTLDLADPDSIVRTVQEIKPQLIINPAAYTAVDKAESEPELAMAINGIAPGILAEQAKKLGVPLIHYSTDYVFDGTKRGAKGELIPYTEDDTPNPINVYGKTKLAGEQAIQASGCQHLILRTSWVYSMYGKNFLLTMLRLAKERDELKIVDDQWGAPTWAGWIAQATCVLINQYDSNKLNAQGLVNLVNSGVTTWYGFAQEIFSQANRIELIYKIPALRSISTQDYKTSAKRPINSTLHTKNLSLHLGNYPPKWQVSLNVCVEKFSL